ncbi:J domain-containing protein [Umezakia ovalisporum]|jgi:molecular chaperone DnaJ|uniref:DnaJ domain-containing protein n=1 Tax=Umezakia ovalisporum FSS-43 TaxID=2740520 RepID=A0ABT6K793_9CYAN|nr:J domain-containing protein [Umezakia ovalisporum]MBI1243251.1 DnaJ domain-containing protein [Nostoc sp. RI_552]MDH6058117.1 DnaJ domain-containing protein [Umezakia ovalisporum FSS-43]MDH6066259.1 DnaJ domain-containing protein [Umezakia ovalisporum APH033B]MDH6071818.1 DnaJ domain-containing protein [Umezakia ovalisporum CobakiLakeA]MDH6073563.1 DnaJ domain-containing protein [Umezakia ovalisporum CS-1034]
MVDSKHVSNHYETLKVNANATQAEIKQSYRRLVKLFHPDSNQQTADKEEIIRINAAYEVLGDTQNRLDYDQQLQEESQKLNSSYQQRAASAQKHYQATRQTGREADEYLEEWLRLVYQPVIELLDNILSSLEEQIEQLAADPFDDQLIEQFEKYLNACGEDLKKAQLTFQSLPNPPSLAKTAAYLYHSLSQVADGVEELGYFPLSYDERYLHTGQELFRIAARLHHEVQNLR